MKNYFLYLLVGVLLTACSATKENLYRKNRVKSVIAIENNGFTIKKLEQEYNRKGLLIKESFQENHADYDYTNFNYYNKSGKLDSTIIYSLNCDSLRTIVLYRYNKREHIKEYYFANGELERRSIRLLDKKGNILSFRSYSGSGEKTHEFTCTYDKIGCKSKIFSIDDEVFYTQVRVMGKKNEKKYESYNNEKEVVEMKHLFYDKKGRVVEYLFFECFGWCAIEEHLKYSYFDNGLLKEEVFYNAEGQEIGKKTYHYIYW